MADTHMGAEALGLFTRFETDKYVPGISKVTQDIKQENQNIKAIHKVITQLDTDAKSSGRVDWSNDPEKIALLDAIRFTNLIDHGQYKWTTIESIDKLTTSLNNYINQVISPNISLMTNHMQHMTYEEKEIVEIMHKMIKDCQDLIKSIYANLRAAAR